MFSCVEFGCKRECIHFLIQLFFWCIICKMCWYLSSQVRWYIEMCLKGYMTKWEIIECLARRANIEPAFTRIGKMMCLLSLITVEKTHSSYIHLFVCVPVLERLEEENEEFFRGYNLRMALRHHIVRHNNSFHCRKRSCINL